MAHLELDVSAICRKVFTFIFPGKIFFICHSHGPCSSALAHTKKPGAVSKIKAARCTEGLVAERRVLLDVVFAGFLFWVWVWFGKSCGHHGNESSMWKCWPFFKFKKSRGGLFAFYFVPFHAKEPFRTASRRHRNTSIAGGSKEETLNANRIPGTAGSARISVRLSSRGSIDHYNGCLGASQLGFNPTATHVPCIIEAPTSRRIFFNIAMLLPDWDAVRVLDKHFRRSLNLQMMLIFILCTALLLSRCQGELTRYTWSLCLADAVDRDQLRALKVCTWRRVSLVKLVTVCSFERCISKRPSKSFGRQSEIGWWSGWIEYCICKHVGT